MGILNSHYGQIWHVCSKQTFSYVDSQIFQSIWRWATRRHPEKGKRWVKTKYFRSNGNKRWEFSTVITDKSGNRTEVKLQKASSTPIKRHVKIKAESTPYNSAYHTYLGERLQRRLREKQNPIKLKWWLLWRMLLNIKDKKAGSPQSGFREARAG